MPDSHFLSFGAGSPNFIRAVHRIASQARRTGLFRTVSFRTDADLRSDPEFWSRHGRFVESHPKGYGYFVWKPYIVLKMLENPAIPDGDLVLYCDSGCEINVHGKERMEYYISQALEHGELVFRNPRCVECLHTKTDVLRRFRDLQIEDALSDQVAASTLFLVKSDRSRALAREWYDACCADAETDYHAITDAPSVLTPDPPGFVAHRYDQSVWSCVAKSHKLHCMPCEYWFGADYYKGIPFPIWQVPNRSGFDFSAYIYGLHAGGYPNPIPLHQEYLFTIAKIQERPFGADEIRGTAYWCAKSDL